MIHLVFSLIEDKRSKMIRIEKRKIPVVWEFICCFDSVSLLQVSRREPRPMPITELHNPASAMRIPRLFGEVARRIRPFHGFFHFFLPFRGRLALRRAASVLASLFALPPFRPPRRPSACACGFFIVSWRLALRLCSRGLKQSIHRR